MIFAQQSLPHTSWEFYGLAVLMLAQTIPIILAYLKGKENSKDIKDVAVKVDGKMEQLLAVSSVADKATGRQQERHHYESLEADAIISGKVIIQAAEVKALAILEAAEVKARETLKLAAITPPEPPGELGVRKVRES